MADSSSIDINFLRHQLEQEKAKNGAHLKSGGGGGTFDGMEARVAKLEASVGYIEREITDIKTEVRGLRSDARTDFRLTFGALIAVAIGLAGLMAKGFGWI